MEDVGEDPWWMAERVSRHPLRTTYFATLGEMCDAFEREASWYERELYGSNEACPGFLGHAHDPKAFGWSRVGCRAVEHAAATRQMIVEAWHSRHDPREEADAEVAELVRGVWWQVSADVESARPGWSDSSLGSFPDLFEERPERLPRVAGVRYYPASQMAQVGVVVPDGASVVVVVRGDDVDDGDWEQICDLADPGALPDPDVVGQPEPDDEPSSATHAARKSRSGQ